MTAASHACWRPGPVPSARRGAAPDAAPVVDVRVLVVGTRKASRYPGGLS
jgi:hypothetical protein